MKAIQQLEDKTGVSDPFTERQALRFLEKTSHLGLLKKYSLAHKAILEKLISHHRWNTSLLGPNQDRCYPSVASAALAIKGSPNRARVLLKELEEACLIRRTEQWNDIGRQTTNLYSLTPVLYYDYLVHLQLSNPPSEENDLALVSLQTARAEAIATEQAFHQSQPKPSSILGLKGAAKTRIQVLTKMLADGATTSKSGEDLHALLAHWQRVYAEHSRHAEAVRAAKKCTKNPAEPKISGTPSTSGGTPPNPVGVPHQIQWGEATGFGGQTSQDNLLDLTPPILTTHSTRTHAYKKNNPATEPVVSEVYTQLLVMDLFGRFARALGQAEETTKARHRFAKTIAEASQGGPERLEEALALVAESLELIEKVPPLQEKPENGGVHSLGRLLHADSLAEVAANAKRQALKFVAERCKAGFNGQVAHGHAMVILAHQQGWDPVATFDWLSDQPATDAEKQLILAYAAELKQSQATYTETINEKNGEISASQAEKIEFTHAHEFDHSAEKTSGIVGKESVNQALVETGDVKNELSQDSSQPSQKATDSNLNQPIDLNTRAKNAARLASKTTLELVNLYLEYEALPNLQTKLLYVQKLESFTRRAKAG